MTGLIYKEVRQNRQYLWFVGLFAPLILLLFLLFLLIMAASSDTSFSDLFSDMTLTGENGSQLSMIMFYCGLLPFGITGMFSLYLFQQDETKKWGYFTASHPKGIQGAMYAKYAVIFILSVITFVSVTLTEEIIYLLEHLILGAELKDMTSGQIIYVLLFFLQIFLRMFDIPFIVRFGKKRGESVKVMAVGGIFIGAIIYALFGPLPGEDGEFFIQLYDWWEKFKEGAAQDWVYFLLAAFLWITIFGYYFSYRLSCKLYMKGVEQYDK